MTSTTTSHRIPETLKTLITQEALEQRVQEMAEEMNRVYAQSEELVIICILKGGFMFAAELVKHLTVPCHIEFIRLASYGNSKQSSGTVKPVDLTLPNLNGRDVLLVEDIIDTGLTLRFFIDYLASLHTPKSLRLAVLLDKKETRVNPVETHFTGFEIENHFVVGFGLDHEGLYRNLPYIGYYPAD